MGIIDNDIVGIDVIIGYFIVIDIVMSFIDKVCDIVDVFECIFFVEVMGCNVGFLVLNGVFFVVVDYVVVFEFFEFVEIEIKKIVN